MKFKHGDLVRVKENADRIPVGLKYAEGMKPFLGNVFLISRGEPDGYGKRMDYRLVSINSYSEIDRYWFAEDWLELVDNSPDISEENLLTLFER